MLLSTVKKSLSWFKYLTIRPLNIRTFPRCASICPGPVTLPREEDRIISKKISAQDNVHEEECSEARAFKTYVNYQIPPSSRPHLSRQWWLQPLIASARSLRTETILRVSHTLFGVKGWSRINRKAKWNWVATADLSAAADQYNSYHRYPCTQGENSDRDGDNDYHHITCYCYLRKVIPGSTNMYWKVKTSETASARSTSSEPYWSIFHVSNQVTNPIKRLKEHRIGYYPNYKNPKYRFSTPLI